MLDTKPNTVPLGANSSLVELMTAAGLAPNLALAIAGAVTPASATENEDDLLTPGDLADELGLRPATLADWRCTGRGPRFEKLGKAVRYRRGDVRRWRTEQVRRSTSDPGSKMACA